MSISLTQLRTYLATVRTGSVTAAADDLAVTQPSVSAALSALTRELGVELTERVGRSIRTTAAGESFAPYAADVIGLLEQGRRAAREAAAASERELRLAAVTTAAEYLVPPLVRAFCERHPEVGVTIDVGNRDRVARRLLDHDADVAIGSALPGGRLVAVPFLENLLVLVASPDDPLAGRRSVPVEALGDRAWLLREKGSGTRAVTEQFLASHDLRPKVLTVGSNLAVKRAAMAGLGVSLQPRLVAGPELASGALAAIGLSESLPRRAWQVVRSPAGPVREPVAALMAFVERPEARAAVMAASGAVPALAAPAEATG